MGGQPGSHGFPPFNEDTTNLDPWSSDNLTADLDMSSGTAGQPDQDWTRVLQHMYGTPGPALEYTVPPSQHGDTTLPLSENGQTDPTSDLNGQNASYFDPFLTSVPQQAYLRIDNLQQQGQTFPHNTSTTLDGRYEPRKQSAIEPLVNDFVFDPDFDFSGFQNDCRPSTGIVAPEEPQQRSQPCGGTPASDSIPQQSLRRQVPDSYQSQYLSWQQNHETSQPENAAVGQYHERRPVAEPQQLQASITTAARNAADFQGLVRSSSDARHHIQHIRQSNQAAVDERKRGRLPSSSSQRIVGPGVAAFPGVQAMFKSQRAQSTGRQHMEVAKKNAHTLDSGSLSSAPSASASTRSGYSHTNPTPSRTKSQQRLLPPFTASPSQHLIQAPSSLQGSMLMTVVNGGKIVTHPAPGSEVATQHHKPHSFLTNDSSHKPRLPKTSLTMSTSSATSDAPNQQPVQNGNLVLLATQQRVTPLIMTDATETAVAPDTPRVKSESTGSRKTRKLKSGQRIQAGSDQLFVQDLTHAQSLAIKRRPLTITKDDRAKVASHPETWIPLITKALDAECQPQPGQPDEYTPEALTEWTRWQKEHESKCWDILTNEADAKLFAQACAWFLYDAVLEAHRDGQGPRDVNGTVANGGSNAGLKCSDRLLATIKALERFSIVRYDLLRLDRLEDFLASPQGFMDRKVNNMWTNYRKKAPFASPKIAEAGNNATATGSSASKGPGKGKRKAAQMEDVTAEDGSVTDASASNKKQKVDPQPQCQVTPSQTAAPDTHKTDILSSTPEATLEDAKPSIEGDGADDGNMDAMVNLTEVARQ